jgi:hypothetical protein
MPDGLNLGGDMLAGKVITELIAHASGTPFSVAATRLLSLRPA